MSKKSIRQKKNELPYFEHLEIIDAGSEGKALGRVENRVVFVPFVVPGDTIRAKATKKKSAYYEARMLEIEKYSDKRTDPMCEHFSICGGCKWQNMSYDWQLHYKQKQVEDNLHRIGKFEMPDVLHILPSKNIYHYRNKLEYSFSNKKWLTKFSREIDFADYNMNGLGFHMPGMFDRILDLDNCYLQAHPSNDIRKAVKQYADEHKLSFYDIKNWTGLLRNLIIRNTTTSKLMIILVVTERDKEAIGGILNHLKDRFAEITSLMFVINGKKNDTINDLEVELFSGDPFIMEEMEGLQFKIGPLSFYQTNPVQAYELYKTAREFAGLTGNEIVYDLYTGTGTIANFVASKAKKVVGIEYLESAILDARENSLINKIKNTVFYSGDMAKELTPEFFENNGKPDVVITDPPRAGMHENVLQQLLLAAPEKIVYVSCNPATQARDVTFLSSAYEVKKIQPVDMFPQTHHVENVMLLVRKA